MYPQTHPITPVKGPRLPSLTLARRQGSGSLVSREINEGVRTAAGGFFPFSGRSRTLTFPSTSSSSLPVRFVTIPSRIGLAIPVESFRGQRRTSLVILRKCDLIWRLIPNLLYVSFFRPSPPQVLVCGVRPSISGHGPRRQQPHSLPLSKCSRRGNSDGGSVPLH